MIIKKSSIFVKGQRNIITVSVFVIALFVLIYAWNSNKTNKRLKVENVQSQIIIEELEAEQTEKATRELTELMQNASFIIEVNANCPPDDMLATMSELYENFGINNTEIEVAYEKLIIELQRTKCF